MLFGKNNLIIFTYTHSRLQFMFSHISFDKKFYFYDDFLTSLDLIK